MRLGRRRPARQTSPKAWLVSSDVVDIGAEPAAGPRRLIGAVVGSRQRAVGVRKDEELEVVVAERQLARSARASRARGAGASTPRSVKAGTQRSVTSAIAPSAPRPTRAARNSSGSARLGADERRAVGEHQRQLGDLRGDVPQAAPRCRAWRWRSPRRSLCTSMSPRFSIASPCAASCRAQLVDRDAGLDAHQPRVAIDVEHPLEPPQAEHQAVRAARCR